MMTETKMYEVFYADRLHTNCDQPGITFKYKATCISQQTGKVTNLNRESMFINKHAFIATLTRWNIVQSGNLKWWYTPAEKVRTTINNKEIEYTEMTVFNVEMGKGKGSYEKYNTYHGKMTSGFLYYMGISVHSGFKKRFTMQHPGGKKIVIHRVISGKDF